MGVYGILIFFIFNDTDVNPRNIISNYGILTVACIKACSMNYIGQKIRQAHNSVQTYYFNSKSITKAVHLKIVVESQNIQNKEHM